MKPESSGGGKLLNGKFRVLKKSRLFFAVSMF
jgi:hypothetical protein